jgi:pimeloyl-ACP methyl ester carboxylesterase
MARTVGQIAIDYGRGILATVLGVLVAGLCISLVQALGHRLYPPPEGLRRDDVEALAVYVAQAPIGALLAVLLSWVVGIFAGGLLAASIARRRPRLYAGVVAAVVLLGAILNFAAIPHPVWFVLTSIAALGVCSALSGLTASSLFHRRAQRINAGTHRA